MNNKIAVRKCNEYDLHEVFDLISEIYKKTDGPDVKGKKVLVKPNILTDDNPAKCISTHPVVVEAMIRFLQSKEQLFWSAIHLLFIHRSSEVKNQVSGRFVKQQVQNGLISC